MVLKSKILGFLSKIYGTSFQNFNCQRLKWSILSEESKFSLAPSLAYHGNKLIHSIVYIK